MNLSLETNLLTGEMALGLVKLMFIIGAGIYLIFALIVVRQITMMRKTLITSFSPLVLMLGMAHLALSGLVFLFLWVLL